MGAKGLLLGCYRIDTTVLLGNVVGVLHICYKDVTESCTSLWYTVLQCNALNSLSLQSISMEYYRSTVSVTAERYFCVVNPRHWSVNCISGTASHVSVSHCTALHSTALHVTTSHCTALHGTPSYCTTLHCTASHCTALHGTALHVTSSHCTVLHGTSSHCITLHCTSLHCTVLHGIASHITTLRCTASHYIASHVTTLHCTTLSDT